MTKEDLEHKVQYCIRPEDNTEIMEHYLDILNDRRYRIIDSYSDESHWEHIEITLDKTLDPETLQQIKYAGWRVYQRI